MDHLWVRNKTSPWLHIENAAFARLEIYTSIPLKMCSDTFHQPFCTLPESEQIYLGIKIHLNFQPLAQSDYRSSCHNMQKVSDFFFLINQCLHQYCQDTIFPD